MLPLIDLPKWAKGIFIAYKNQEYKRSLVIPNRSSGTFVEIFKSEEFVGTYPNTVKMLNLVRVVRDEDKDWLCIPYKSIQKPELKLRFYRIYNYDLRDEAYSDWLRKINER